MTTSEKIQDICDRIARDFRPEKIIVFGSHVYGTPGPFSDLDLLIVMPFEGSPLQQAARIISRISLLSRPAVRREILEGANRRGWAASAEDAQPVCVANTDPSYRAVVWAA
jgi:predicted nucleotidyltransferase